MAWVATVLVVATGAALLSAAFYPLVAFVIVNILITKAGSRATRFAAVFSTAVVIAVASMITVAAVATVATVMRSAIVVVPTMVVVAVMAIVAVPVGVAIIPIAPDPSIDQAVV